MCHLCSQCYFRLHKDVCSCLKSYLYKKKHHSTMLNNAVFIGPAQHRSEDANLLHTAYLDADIRSRCNRLLGSHFKIVSWKLKT